MAKNGYDPGLDPEYQKYLAQLEAARGEKPRYDSAYAGQARELLRQLNDRPEFSYDINTDALYDQYRRSYTRQGQHAMADTMARAQTMTGGYGNSYAQTAGQQVYQSYLEQLGDRIPELYKQALQRYQAEGEALKQRYELAAAGEKREYDRYQGELDAYGKTLDRLQSQADQAYDRGYRQHKDAYQRQQNAYNALVKLIQRGYTPTDQELEEAGMTRAQAEALGKR